MSRRRQKYITLVALLAVWGHMVFATGRPQQPGPSSFGVDSTGVYADDPGVISVSDTVPGAERLLSEGLSEAEADTTLPPSPPARRRPVEMKADTAAKEGKSKGFLDDVISGNNKDSVIFNVRDNKVFIYREGDIKYQDMNLKADYMEVDIETKNVFGHGYADSTGATSRAEFMQGSQKFTLDTLAYNLDTRRAKIKGVQTQEGDGYLTGRAIKREADGTASIVDGKYTTCDHVDHPHFYIAMTKAKLIPNKKVITGYSYLVMEDVPIPFPALPFGFFPITSGRKSGIIIPTFGEEYVKGFFLRQGGYYWAMNDYMDLTMLGGYYTLGSWEASSQFRYIRRYRYHGGLNFQYAKTIIGEKSDLDYTNQGSFSLQWTHTQDPKFKPNSSFSASVNLSSSGYTQHGTNSLQQHLTTQTSSTISYSKSWPGKPFSMSANLGHSQNSRDETYMLTLPNVTFNMSRINPFKGKNYVGKEKWYHKISLSYSGAFKNTVKVQEKDLFTETMFKGMDNGVQHNIPVQASFNLLNYLNVTPNFTYTERWYFRKFNQEFDPEKNAAVVSDTTYGFYRSYNYNLSVSMTTKVYGMFEFLGKNPVVKAVRHVMTPTVSFSYTPDFSEPKYGFYKPVQSDSMGSIKYYSPYSGVGFGVPGSGESMSLNFGLQNTLEAKVRSQSDTTGFKKIKILDDLSLRGSYNFLADSLNLSAISFTARSSIVPGINLNFNASFDPYQINENGARINKFMVKSGKLARMTSASTSFAYSFNGGQSGSQPAMNNPGNSTKTPTPEEQDFFNRNNVDPEEQRRLMTSQYYDFNIPWNFGFNYSFSYSKPGHQENITQTLGFNGSVNLTSKWGVNFSGGYDMDQKKISHMSVSILRDLHCWQMNLQWIPIGTMQSWQFNISVKSGVLRDLKYDRRSSRYDTLFDKY